ncbi:MAG TPA: putative sulfate exporter family transporter [Myxococcota bacterium]|nr:putative sulfate exporter family transporter [Myxococcota bacterium]
MVSARRAVPRFEDPQRYRFAGAMEGVPEISTAAAPQVSRLRALGHAALDAAARVLPGAALAGLLAFAAVAASDWIGIACLGTAQSPVPPALVAIGLGLAIRNAIGLPTAYDAGLRFCVQRVLRIGVALLGLRLSLAAVGGIGLAALPIVTACIATALALVALVTRWLGLPARLGTLIAVGTAICGNSAIAATGPAIGARDDEVSYAVGCVTLFGLFALLIYPFLSRSLFGGDPRLAGLFLGAAIQDTAQVAGAGMLAAEHWGGGSVLETAAVTKLLRNAFMIAVVPGMAWWHHHPRWSSLACGSRREHPRSLREACAPGARLRVPRFTQAVPWFVLGFLALALLRTLGDLGGDAPFAGSISGAAWQRVLASGQSLSAASLALAMAAIGLGTNLRELRGLGLRPLAVGLAAALATGAVATAMIKLIA